MRNIVLAILLILASAAIFYLLVVADFNPIAKFIAGIALLLATSFGLRKLLSIEGQYGLLLWRTTAGLDLMDKLANAAPNFWKFFAHLGFVIGFGMASPYILRDISLKTYALGMLLLLIFSTQILPFAAPLITDLVNLPTTAQNISAAAQTFAQAGGLDAANLIAQGFQIAMILALLYGGLTLVAALGLGYKAFTVLFQLVFFALQWLGGYRGASTLACEGPGAAPILPGINLPFAEGILALAVLLVVHEAAHGILARVDKIRLQSAGLVFFGILPFGAFVDPDEEQLKTTSHQTQHRVLVAGSASNLFTAILFFLIFFAFYFAVLNIHPSTQLNSSTGVELSCVLLNSPAYGQLKSGMKVKQWNGVNVTSIDGFRQAANGTREGDFVNVTTDAASFSIRAGPDGKIGIQASEKIYTFGDHIRSLGGAWLFLYNFLGLAFVLNVLVGIVNLLPIPPFDGYRIFALWVGERKLFGNLKLVDVIVAFLIAFFLVNFLPWAWLS